MMPGRLLVKRKETTKSLGGILLPEAQKERVGQVVAIGGPLIKDNGTKLPVPVEVGDWVMFKEIGDIRLQVEGVEYLHLTFPDLLITVAND